jgi:nucleoside 2-deoxyribosyltransferase
MAMKYNDEQLDKIVDEIFKPAVKQTGFDLFKLIDRQPAGLIDDRIRVEIQTSRFLIADLTHENRGAYWEAGYAEGLGKPVIYTCEKKVFDDPKTKPHFDTNHHLTILWDTENPKEAAEKLKATIRATLPEAAKLTDD